MLQREPQTVRVLRRADSSTISRIISTSEYVHARFDAGELPHLLASCPAVGAFNSPPGPLVRVTGGSLQAFLLVNWLVPPSAWIGGFGVTWSEGQRFEHYLDLLLPALERAVWQRGARTLYYSSGDVESDWLRDALERRRFALVSLLRSYDKYDTAIPSSGNAEVRVRPFTPEDMAGVIAVEQEAFEQRWRHDAASFREVAAHYPYFVVAEDASGIIGYQFNTLDVDTGYLVRIALHPRVFGRGVGTRLMAEAIHYFARNHVRKIALNAEELNGRAHALYERFGFVRVPPRGIVLARAIAAPRSE
jgi:ribosomal protein S18 acetylase RimI-like enzyme